MTSLRLRLAWQRWRMHRGPGGVVGRSDAGGACDYLHRHRLQDAQHPGVSLAGERATCARKLTAQKAGEGVAEVARTQSIDKRVDG